MEHDLRRWMKLCETAEQVPITAWADIQTGVPATFHGWRGINGGRTPLAQHNRESLGRDWLLGDGIYVAPTRHMAAKYGAPIIRDPYPAAHRVDVGDQTDRPCGDPASP
jgi:hypothetical protein